MVPASGSHACSLGPLFTLTGKSLDRAAGAEKESVWTPSATPLASQRNALPPRRPVQATLRGSRRSRSPKSACGHMPMTSTATNQSIRGQIQLRAAGAEGHVQVGIPGPDKAPGRDVPERILRPDLGFDPLRVREPGVGSQDQPLARVLEFSDEAERGEAPGLEEGEPRVQAGGAERFVERQRRREDALGPLDVGRSARWARPDQLRGRAVEFERRRCATTHRRADEHARFEPMAAVRDAARNPNESRRQP